MAAASVFENWEFMGEGKPEGIQIPGIDSTLLMFLLEEPSQVEDVKEDERLQYIIQSLEAEIDDPNMKGNRKDGATQDFGSGEDLSEVKESRSLPTHELDRFDDMEMHSSSTSSLPSDELGYGGSGCLMELHGVSLEDPPIGCLWQ